MTHSNCVLNVELNAERQHKYVLDDLLLLLHILHKIYSMCIKIISQLPAASLPGNQGQAPGICQGK